MSTSSFQPASSATPNASIADTHDTVLSIYPIVRKTGGWEGQPGYEFKLHSSSPSSADLPNHTVWKIGANSSIQESLERGVKRWKATYAQYGPSDVVIGAWRQQHVNAEESGAENGTATLSTVNIPEISSTPIKCEWHASAQSFEASRGTDLPMTYGYQLPYILYDLSNPRLLCGESHLPKDWDERVQRAQSSGELNHLTPAEVTTLMDHPVSVINGRVTRISAERSLEEVLQYAAQSAQQVYLGNTDPTRAFKLLTALDIREAAKGITEGTSLPPIKLDMNFDGVLTRDYQDWSAVHGYPKAV